MLNPEKQKKMTSELGRGAPAPEELSLFSGENRRGLASPVLTRELIPVTRLFSRGIFEEQSGIQLFIKKGEVRARLGQRQLGLDGVSPEALTLRYPGPKFAPELVQAFEQQVVPQLIIPTRILLEVEVKALAAGTKPTGSFVESVSVTKEEPLTCIITGLVGLGKRSEVELVWNDSGALIAKDLLTGMIFSMPLADLVKWSKNEAGILQSALTCVFGYDINRTLGMMKYVSRT